MTRAPRHLASAPRPVVRALLPALAAAFLAARLASAHGAVHERLAEVSAEIALHPSAAALYLERAELSRVDGAADSALADLARAAALDPALPRIDLCRGAVLLSLGRAAEAERALSRFLDAQPGESEALRLRARARAALGRPLEGADDLASAIAHAARVTPDDYLGRSRLLRAAGAGHGAAGLAALEEGIARLGPAASLELEALEIEVSLSRFGAALARLDTMRRWLPEESWRARRAGVFADSGRTMEARAEYSGALEAIAALPARRRDSPATRDLERRVREALRSLGAAESR